MSLIVPTVSVEVKQHLNLKINSELRSWCVEVEVDILGSPSLIVIVLMVSVDVTQH